MNDVSRRFRNPQKLISEQSDTIDLLTAIIAERDETIKLQKAMNRSNLRIIGEQETILDRLTARLEAFDEVMNNSAGVAGWHRNGDIAAWAELNLEGE